MSHNKDHRLCENFYTAFMKSQRRGRIIHYKQVRNSKYWMKRTKRIAELNLKSEAQRQRSILKTLHF